MGNNSEALTPTVTIGITAYNRPALLREAVLSVLNQAYGNFELLIGNDYIEKELPKLIKMITQNNLNIIWSCDPMHGNTYQSKNNYKTRNFKTIINELKIFFKIHNNSSTYPGAVHFELTPNHVTECLGGVRNIKESDLHINYETACDPRLNHEQSLELAFVITDLINEIK